MIPSPRLGFLRGVFLASTDNLTTNKTQHIPMQINYAYKEVLINSNTIKMKKALRGDVNTAQ